MDATADPMLCYNGCCLQACKFPLQFLQSEQTASAPRAHVPWRHAAGIIVLRTSDYPHQVSQVSNQLAELEGETFRRKGQADSGSCDGINSTVTQQNQHRKLVVLGMSNTMP